MKNILKDVLIFLSGKKGAIASILGAIVAYLATKGILGEQEVILVGAILTVVFGGTSVATKKVVYPKK